MNINNEEILKRKVEDYEDTIIHYLNGVYNKDDVLEVFEIAECTCCSCYDLEKYMHRNDDGVYCETCWDAR